MRFTRSVRSILSLVRRFGRDQSAKYAVVAVFVLPVLIGAVGFGAEYGLWVYKHGVMQNASEKAAVAAAAAGGNAAQKAIAVTTSAGFVDGVNGTTVTVNRLPQSGPQANNSGAVEVIVEQTQQRLLSRLIEPEPTMLQARAVAVVVPGTGCALALNATARDALVVPNGVGVTLDGCSLYANSASNAAMSVDGTLSAQSINVVGRISGSTNGIASTNGIHKGIPPAPDPYASVPVPRLPQGGCFNVRSSKAVTLSERYYCEINIGAGEKFTLNPGVYFIGGLRINSGGEIAGRNVTLIFPPGASATIQPDAHVDLTAPIAGPTAGIVMFGDRNMAVGSPFKLGGGSEQKFSGAVYLPKAALSFSGSANADVPCLQIIADTISFSGTSDLRLDCSSVGTKSIGPASAKLAK